MISKASNLRRGTAKYHTDTMHSTMHSSAQLLAKFYYLFILILLGIASPSHAATPPNTTLSNTVIASYSLQGTPIQKTASVNISTVERTPSTITFFRISTLGTAVPLPKSAFSNSGQTTNPQNWQPINQVTLLDGSQATFPASYPIEPSTQYLINEPIVIEVTDLDQNVDSLITETIFITITVAETGDTEVIQLTETSPSSGKFRGAIQTDGLTANNFNGVLSVAKDAKISVNYRDALDSTDVSATAALVEPEGLISLTKQVSATTASIGESVTYTLDIRSNTIQQGLTHLKIRDLLPPGFRYIANTATLNNTLLADNQVISNGRSLVFVLGTMPTQSNWVIKYRVRIGAGAPLSIAKNTAQAFSDNHNSFIASANVTIKDELMRDHIILTGRVFHGCGEKAPVIKGAHIYIETGQSANTDKEGFWHMDGITPGTHLVKLDTESLADGLTPILCNDNTQFAGKPDSQFIDVKGGGIWRADFHVKGTATASKSADDTSSPVKNPLIDFADDYITTAKKGTEILWPPKGFIPPIASISVVVKHSPQEKITLLLNGEKVSGLNYDGSSTHKDKTVQTSRWRGVDIDVNNRENKLQVIVKNKAGKIINKLDRLVHFSGEPAFAKFDEKRSTLIADGQTSPKIAVLVKDKEGFPLRANSFVYYSLEQGNYQIDDREINKNDSEKLSLSTGSYKGDHKLHIEENGIGYIRLKPGTQSGEIRLTVKLSDNKQQEIKAWITPKIREEWIMVGLAEGTLGYNTLSGNLKTLSDLEKKERIYNNGRVAFFAKGKVKGKYLLTVAYDSAKRRGEVGEQLQGNLDPDAFYTIYGDNATNQFETKSSSKLFIKLEREQFYMLFGDYRTNMTVTELSRYERTLHGIHSEYKGRNYRLNTSFSETKNKHQRDEIPGDGTSGEYLLTQPVIPNSEVVMLETRDRFHPERIISQRLLALHADYEIDYDSHSLFFKFPISSRDHNLNPTFIVVDYESDSNAKKSIAASGRVAYLTNNGKTEIGLSLIHENNNRGDSSNLVGTDITYKLNESETIKAEIAQSNGSSSGTAWLLEAEKKTKKITSRAYIRQQDATFGLEQQNISERGTRKIGVDGRYNFGENNQTYIRSDMFHQENLDNNNERNQISLEFGKENKQSKYAVGIRHTKELTNGISRKGTLLTLGGSVSPDNGRVTLRSTIEKNIGGRGANEAYPDRYIIGADIGLTDGVALFIEREITRSDDVDTTTDRMGLTSKLWEGASLKSSVNRENQYGGDRTFATLDLAQHLNLTDNLSADLSVDHSKTINDSQLTPVDSDQPAINGSIRDDYTAFAVGLGWRDEDWSWTGRLEHRNGDRENKDNFRFGFLHELGNGKDVSARIGVTHSRLSTGLEISKATLSLGSAWHPQESDYTVLQRLDFTHEETLGSTNGLNDKQTQKVIHNLHINKKVGKKTQISLHHGIKHTLEDEFNQSFNSTVDTAQLQIRRNLSSKMDVGVHAGYLHDWKTDNWQYNYGGSMGLTPATNMWLSIGYNLEGFTDEDFDQSDYTAQGPFLQLLYRADKDQLSKLVKFKKATDSAKKAKLTEQNMSHKNDNKT